MKPFPVDIWWSILAFLNGSDNLITIIPKLCRESRRWSRTQAFILTLWNCQIVKQQEDSKGMNALTCTDFSKIARTLIWFETVGSVPLQYVCRTWDDDRELVIPEEEQTSRMQSCLAEGQLQVQDETAKEDVVVHETPVMFADEESFLRTHTCVVRAQDYTWINHYTDTYLTKEQKKARYIHVIGLTGEVVSMRYYEVDLIGDFPKFFCRLDCCVGLDFQAANDSGNTMPILQIGFGRVEVDIRPTVYGETLRKLRNRLGLQDSFPLCSLWDVLIAKVPLQGLLSHSRTLKSQHGGTLKGAVQSLSNDAVPATAQDSESSDED
eukprot:PhF_6_TR19586/c0_g1_i1/m.28560